MKLILSFFFILTLAGCAAVPTDNRVERATNTFKGGLLGEEVWSDRLSFTKLGFYNGASLIFDIYMTRLDANSRFTAWLSPYEKEALASCKQFLVTMDYNNWRSLIKHRDFVIQMEKNGFKEVQIPYFATQIKSHPNYNDWNLNYHRVQAFCKQSELGGNDPLEITFPGYRTVKVEL